MKSIAWLALAAFWLLVLPSHMEARVVQAAPAVPQIAVVAENPVDGVRALAKQRNASYQVFLWRAQHYLEEQCRDKSFEEIKAFLEAAGATQIGETDDANTHTVRYAVQKKVIRSRVGRSHTCIIELNEAPKAKQVWVQVSIMVEFGLDFKTAARRRDYAKGTVLDRVFGLIDLERRARETPRLDSIEVSYGLIGYISSPDWGNGFHLAVYMSNPSPRGKLNSQHLYYMAVSGLDPLGPWSNRVDLDKATIHVARDTLVPGVLFADHFPEHRYPPTFGSVGWGSSPRKPSTPDAVK
jgi:hypothetical protein